MFPIKIPGPDGEFYQTSEEELRLILLKLFQKNWRGGNIFTCILDKLYVHCMCLVPTPFLSWFFLGISPKRCQTKHTIHSFWTFLTWLLHSINAADHFFLRKFLGFHDAMTSVFLLTTLVFSTTLSAHHLNVHDSLRFVSSHVWIKILWFTSVRNIYNFN